MIACEKTLGFSRCKPLSGSNLFEKTCVISHVMVPPGVFYLDLERWSRAKRGGREFHEVIRRRMRVCRDFGTTVAFLIFDDFWGRNPPFTLANRGPCLAFRRIFDESALLRSRLQSHLSILDTNCFFAQGTIRSFAARFRPGRKSPASVVSSDTVRLSHLQCMQSMSLRSLHPFNTHTTMPKHTIHYCFPIAGGAL